MDRRRLALGQVTKDEAAPAEHMSPTEKLSRVQSLFATLTPRRYKPVLIVVPAGATGVWKDEAAHFLDLTLQMFLSDKKRSAVKDRDRILDPDVTDLLRWVRPATKQVLLQKHLQRLMATKLGWL